MTILTRRGFVAVLAAAPAIGAASLPKITVVKDQREYQVRKHGILTY